MLLRCVLFSTVVMLVALVASFAFGSLRVHFAAEPAAPTWVLDYLLVSAGFAALCGTGAAVASVIARYRTRSSSLLRIAGIAAGAALALSPAMAVDFSFPDVSDLAVLLGLLSISIAICWVLLHFGSPNKPLHPILGSGAPRRPSDG